MTKVVTGKLNGHVKEKPPGVTETWGRDAEGRRVKLRVLDIDSATFGEDFRYVFERNVARIVRRNKRSGDASDVGRREG